MRFGRRIALVCAVVITCAMCSACADPAISRESGCHDEVQEVAGVIRPETSGLSCAQIKKLIEVQPSDPGGFLVIGEEPHRLWKCRIYVPKKSKVSLGCTHHQEHFSVIGETG